MTSVVAGPVAQVERLDVHPFGVEHMTRPRRTRKARPGRAIASKARGQSSSVPSSKPTR